MARGPSVRPLEGNRHRGHHEERSKFPLGTSSPLRGGRGRPNGGPPFGGFRERGFGHGPHVGRGDVRSAALALLADGPRHGYQIIQEISERSGGVWRPSPGSVYPALQLLEDEGLIRAEQVDARRVFHLTEAGLAYVRDRQDELSAIWNAVTESVDDSMVELRDLFEQVGAAVRHVVRAGGKAEIAEARQVLVNTRRQLYRILADAEPASHERPSGTTTPVS